MTRFHLTLILNIISFAEVFAQPELINTNYFGYSLKFNLSNQICVNEIRFSIGRLHLVFPEYINQMNSRSTIIDKFIFSANEPVPHHDSSEYCKDNRCNFEYEINMIIGSVQEVNHYDFMPVISTVACWIKQRYHNKYNQAFYNWKDNSCMGVSLSVPLFDMTRKQNINKPDRISSELNFRLHEQSFILYLSGITIYSFVRFTLIFASFT